jgi:hypothetical protein
MVFKLLCWKRKWAEKPKRRVAKPKRRVEKRTSGAEEMTRRAVASDNASDIVPAIRSSFHRSTQSRQSILNQKDEACDSHVKDWIYESDLSPLRNDVSNPDLILRSRTVDSVEFARRMARPKVLDDTVENFIEYKRPSFVFSVDTRDDISIDDDAPRDVAETQLSGFLQMVQRLLGDEPMSSPSFAVLVEDDMPNEPMKNDFVPLSYIVCRGEEDISFNNEEALTVDSASTNLPSSDQNVKNFVVADFNDDSSTLSGSTSSGTGIITYDGSDDDKDPDILEVFDEASDFFQTFIKVVKNGLWSRT